MQVLSGSHSRLALPMAEDHRVSTSSGSTQVLRRSCSRLSLPLAEDCQVSTSSGSSWVPSRLCSRLSSPIASAPWVSTAGGLPQVAGGSWSGSTFNIAGDCQVSNGSGSTWVLRESHAESTFPIGGGCQVSTAGGSTQVPSRSHSSLTFPIPMWVGSSESTFGLPRDLSVPTSSGLGSSYMGQSSVPSNNSAPAFSKPHGYGPPTHFLMYHHHYSPYQSTARPNDVNGPWIGYNGMFRQQAECFVYNNT